MSRTYSLALYFTKLNNHNMMSNLYAQSHTKKKKFYDKIKYKLNIGQKASFKLKFKEHNIKF